MKPDPNVPPILEGLSTYPLEKLLSKWKSGDLLAEQAIGYLIQNVVLLEKRVRYLEKNTAHGAMRPIDLEPAQQ